MTMNMPIARHALVDIKPVNMQASEYSEDWLNDIQTYTELMKEARETHDQQVSMMKQLDDITTNPSSSNLKRAKLAEIKENLDGLDLRALKLTKELEELEVRVLTYDPEDKEEVTLMLSFVASVLSIDHKIDACYLSDVLEHCSQTLLDAA